MITLLAAFITPLNIILERGTQLLVAWKNEECLFFYELVFIHVHLKFLNLALLWKEYLKMQMM